MDEDDLEKEMKKIMREREGGIEIEVDEVDGKIATLVIDNRFVFYLHFPQGYEMNKNSPENSYFSLSTKEKSKKFVSYLDSLNKYIKQKNARNLSISLEELLLYSSSSYQNFLSYQDSEEDESEGSDENGEDSEDDFFDGEESSSEDLFISSNLNNNINSSIQNNFNLVTEELPVISTLSATQRILSNSSFLFNHF